MNKLYSSIILGLVVLLTGYYLGHQQTDFWISIVINFLSSFLAIFILIGFKPKNIPKKEKAFTNWILILPVLIGFFGLVLLNYFMPQLIFKMLDWETAENLTPNKTESPRFISLMVLIVVIEEILFRRIIAQKIFNEKGWAKAIWISAFTFSIAHWFSDIGLLFALIGGLVLGYIYLKTRNIWITIFAHLFYNLTSLFLSPEISERISYFDSYPKIIGFVIIGTGMICTMRWSINYLIRN